jgi:hypothetical protein
MARLSRASTNPGDAATALQERHRRGGAPLLELQEAEAVGSVGGRRVRLRSPPIRVRGAGEVARRAPRVAEVHPVTALA